MLRAMRRRTIIILASISVVAALFVAGMGWIVWSVIDQVGAPGIPGATGSGACGSADAVNLQLTYADGHTVQVCTRDRPACPNQTIGGSMNGQSLPSRSEFNLSNQLRSSSGRYILFIRFDSGLAAQAAEQTLTLNPGSKLMPGEPAPATLTSALVGITPRDSTGESFTAQSGSLTVSSTQGLARGRIDGSFSGGPGRSDRPAPSATYTPPLAISGTFACNR
jgi:hypothetical protein